MPVGASVSLNACTPSGSMPGPQIASGTGVVLNSPDYVTQYRRRNDVDLEGDLVPAALDVEEAGTSG